jgi:hypothetical protein
MAEGRPADRTHRQCCDSASAVSAKRPPVPRQRSTATVDIFVGKSVPFAAKARNRKARDKLLKL